MLVPIPDEQIAETGEETVYRECASGRISHADLDAMAIKIEDQGRGAAEIICKARSLGVLGEVRRFVISRTALQGTRWSVTGKWQFTHGKESHNDPSRTA
jgi:hypothetical protein